MPEFLFFLIPVVLVVIGLLAYHAHLRAKERREALAVFARSRGWQFAPQYDATWGSRYSQFAWFNTGHSRYAYNLMHGTLEMSGETRPCTLGEYTYKVTSGSGKNRRTTTYYFSFLMVELPFAGLPELAVRPEGFFDRMTTLIGFDDIDFESEEFSRKFHVKSTDKRFAYDLLHPRMMELLLDSPPATFEIERSVLCVRSTGGCWEIAELAGQVDWCQQLLAHWPPHLAADLESRLRR